MDTKAKEADWGSKNGFGRGIIL